MTEKTGILGQDAHEPKDREFLVPAGRRLKSLGFGVDEMTNKGWEYGLTQNGFKWSRTSESYEPGVPIETKVLASEDNLSVKKTQTLSGTTRTVQITEDLSPQGEFQGVRLSLTTEPKEEKDKEEILIVWNSDGSLNKEECLLRKGLERAEALSMAGMVEKFKKSLVGSWRFPSEVIEGKIIVEPEKLLRKTLEQTEQVPRELFNSMVIFFLG